MKVHAAVATTLLCTTFTAAHAQLVDHGSTTYDTATGLEWLDLSASNGQSFKQVSAQFGAGGTFDGYRYATQAEVQNLMGNFGLPVGPYSTFNTSVAPQLASFDSLLGLNVAGIGDPYGFAALTGDAITGFGGYHPLMFMNPMSGNTALGNGTFTAVGDWLVSDASEVTVGYSDKYMSDGLAHFLVRSTAPIPEPSTWALMIGGLGLLGWRARRVMSKG
jgi:hypothetical protein